MILGVQSHLERGRDIISGGVGPWSHGSYTNSIFSGLLPLNDLFMFTRSLDNT